MSDARDTVFQRGDHIELAHHLIDEDERRTGKRPVTDDLDTYHVWDVEADAWRACDDDEQACRVDCLDGARVMTKTGTRPLCIRAADGPAVVGLMKRLTRLSGGRHG